jgi:hypothetical protein
MCCLVKSLLGSFGGHLLLVFLLFGPFWPFGTKSRLAFHISPTFYCLLFCSYENLDDQDGSDIDIGIDNEESTQIREEPQLNPQLDEYRVDTAGILLESDAGYTPFGQKITLLIFNLLHCVREVTGHLLSHLMVQTVGCGTRCSSGKVPKSPSK